MGEVRDGGETKVFEVEDVEAIQAHGSGIAAVPDGLEGSCCSDWEPVGAERVARSGVAAEMPEGPGCGRALGLL